MHSFRSEQVYITQSIFLLVIPPAFNYNHIIYEYKQNVKKNMKINRKIIDTQKFRVYNRNYQKYKTRKYLE